MVECKYRGRVIGELVEGPDGFLRYLSDKPDLITDAHIVRVMSRFLRPVKLAKWPVECKWNPNAQFRLFSFGRMVPRGTSSCAHRAAVACLAKPRAYAYEWRLLVPV